MAADIVVLTTRKAIARLLCGRAGVRLDVARSWHFRVRIARSGAFAASRPVDHSSPGAPEEAWRGLLLVGELLPSKRLRRNLPRPADLLHRQGPGDLRHGVAPEHRQGGRSGIAAGQEPTLRLAGSQCERHDSRLLLERARSLQPAWRATSCGLGFRVAGQAETTN